MFAIAQVQVPHHPLIARLAFHTCRLMNGNITRGVLQLQYDFKIVYPA